MRRQALRFTAVLILSVLAACRTPPPGEPRGSASVKPAEIPAGALHYRVDGQRSQVLVLVRRDGSAAALGHSHVMSIHGLSGDVWWISDTARSVLQLQFPVAAIGVDEPGPRTTQGPEYQDVISDAGIAGTREHMLAADLLDAMDFPNITLRATNLRREGAGWQLSAQITVRDHTASLDIPVSVQQSDREVVARGSFTVTHAQLGLTVHSVMLGTLRVAEELPIQFNIVAARDAG